MCEEEKVEKVVDALYGHFEEKKAKTARIEFTTFMLNKALESTNKELSELNLLNFMELLKNREHYQEEFKEALIIFENKLREHLEKIIYEIIMGIMED